VIQLITHSLYYIRLTSITSNMKKFIVLTALLCLTQFSFAAYIKPEEVPKPLRLTLDSVFPGVNFPVWRSVNVGKLNRYLATFVHEDKRFWAVFTHDHRIVEIEEALEASDIPEKIKVDFHSKYKNTFIDEARIVYTGGKKLFFIHGRDSRRTYNLLYTAEGKIVRKKTDVLKNLLSSFFASLTWTPLFNSSVVANSFISGGYLLFSTTSWNNEIVGNYFGLPVVKKEAQEPVTE
jgi:hypothetical protein